MASEASTDVNPDEESQEKPFVVTEDDKKQRRANKKKKLSGSWANSDAALVDLGKSQGHEVLSDGSQAQPRASPTIVPHMSNSVDGTTPRVSGGTTQDGGPNMTEEDDSTSSEGDYSPPPRRSEVRGVSFLPD